jgi:hypothetical protein
MAGEKMLGNANLNPELELKNLPGNLVAISALCLGAGSRAAYETIADAGQLFDLSY